MDELLCEYKMGMWVLKGGRGKAGMDRELERYHKNNGR
jgi:hypothetical protein